MPLASPSMQPNLSDQSEVQAPLLSNHNSKVLLQVGPLWDSFLHAQVQSDAIADVD